MRHFLSRLSITLLFLCLTVTVVLADSPGPIDKAAIANDVKNEFLHAWNAYRTYAWGHDELHPINKTPFDWYSSPLYLTLLVEFGTLSMLTGEWLSKDGHVDGGCAQLNSVATKEKFDRMESYFVAETLKYLYLLFAPPETLDFDNVIFNTEAHPIRRT